MAKKPSKKDELRSSERELSELEPSLESRPSMETGRQRARRTTGARAAAGPQRGGAAAVELQESVPPEDRDTVVRLREPEELQSEPYIEVEPPRRIRRSTGASDESALRSTESETGGPDVAPSAEDSEEEGGRTGRVSILLAALRTEGDEEGSGAPSPEASTAASALESRPTSSEQELSGEDLQEMATPPPIPTAEDGPFDPPSVAAGDREVRVPMAPVGVSRASGAGVISSAEAEGSPDAPSAGLSTGGDGSAAEGSDDSGARPFAGRRATLAASTAAAANAEPFAEAGGKRQRRLTPVRGSRTRATPSIGTPVVKSGKAWFETIFDEDYLRTVRYASRERTAREVAFIEQTLEPAKDSEIIDLGCGTGRHCLALAERGYRSVTGFDLSLPLLIRGADEAQRGGRKVNFVHGDLREMDFDEQYDVAFTLNTTFGFFDDDSNRHVLQSICEALKVGGRLLVDVVNRDYVVRDLPTRVGWEGDGCLVLEEVAFNFFTSRLNSKRSVVFMDGRHVEHEISIRCYSLHEIGKLLHHSGFRVMEVSGDTVHRGRFFGRESPSLLVVAEKR